MSSGSMKLLFQDHKEPQKSPEIEHKRQVEITISW